MEESGIALFLTSVVLCELSDLTELSGLYRESSVTVIVSGSIGYLCSRKEPNQFFS